MRELGLESEREHRALGQYVAGACPDRALFVGGDARHAAEAAALAGVPAHFFATSELARSSLWESLGPGSVVLVKGSRGVRLETVLAPPEGVPHGQDSATGGSGGL
jgi:UDP-N-acetylmuramoyl-tripeptide--D-alanyl-D-alanine ligase